MRSLLFVPGHNERLLVSASRTDADILLLDLEDSVQPISNKALARTLIKEKLHDGIFYNHLVFPRVNDRESGNLLRDVYELTLPGIHGFVYPKAKHGDDIYFFDKLLETIEYEKNLPIGNFKIIALIETAAAVMNVLEICKASKRLVAIAYGCEDFITDLEGIHDIEENSLFVPRARIAMAARAYKIVPIDTVHINVHDLSDLEKNLKIAKNLGFEGMLVLNPKELPLVHTYFSPTEQEVWEAQEIVRLSEQAIEEGKGVVIKNGRFIGPPIVSAAQKVLKKQKLINSKASL